MLIAEETRFVWENDFWYVLTWTEQNIDIPLHWETHLSVKKEPCFYLESSWSDILAFTYLIDKFKLLRCIGTRIADNKSRPMRIRHWQLIKLKIKIKWIKQPFSPVLNHNEHLYDYIGKCVVFSSSAYTFVDQLLIM